MEEMRDGRCCPFIRCVLWDMDGTLLDSEHVYDLVCAAYAAKEGYPQLTAEYFSGYHGVSPEKSCRIMCRDFAEKRISLVPEEVEKHRVSGYLEWIRMHGVPVFPGVYHVMGKLGAMGILQAVCTSSAYEDAHLSLEMAGLMPKLQAVVYGTDVSRPKPEPDIFLRVAELLGVRPEECLVVEDSVSGLEAARKAGMQVCLRKSGTEAETDLNVFSSLEEILKLFTGAEYGC